MRWKLLLFYLALLGALHFLASPFISRAFNNYARNFFPPTFSVEKISLDLINAQASLHRLRLGLSDSESPPLLEVREAIVHWRFLPLLTKQLVLEDITLAGANFDLPVSLAATLSLKLAGTFKKNISAQYPLRIAFNSWSLADTPLSLPPAAKPRFWLEPKGGDVLVHYPDKGPSLVFGNFYGSDITLRFSGANPERPPLPSFTNLCITVQQNKKSVDFSLQAKLEGQDASYVKAQGSLVPTDGGLEGTCDIRLEGLDIAKFWPWINPAWMPEEFSQFQVVEGVMGATSHVQIHGGRWGMRHEIALMKLKVQADPNSPYRKIRGASPELVVKAVNSLGEAKMQFSSYREWKKQFEENVMKGVRNLIRQSIHDAILGK